MSRLHPPRSQLHPSRLPQQGDTTQWSHGRVRDSSWRDSSMIATQKPEARWPTHAPPCSPPTGATKSPPSRNDRTPARTSAASTNSSPFSKTRPETWLNGVRAADSEDESDDQYSKQGSRNEKLYPLNEPSSTHQELPSGWQSIAQSSVPRPARRSAWYEDDGSRSRQWQQPRFVRSRIHDEIVAKEKMRPPVFGGRSKNDQLGSVEESWGSPPGGERVYGMFEIEADPPSRSTSPFKEIEVRDAREKALQMARLGTPLEGKRDKATTWQSREHLDDSLPDVSHLMPLSERLQGVTLSSLQETDGW